VSNTRKLRTYGQRARAARPGYVTPAAPCDVPGCGHSVGGSRTVTFIAGDGSYRSVLIRLCKAHTGAPYDDLLKLLPALAKLDAAAGPTAYHGPDPREVP
jgi:hypothetical protein